MEDEYKSEKQQWAELQEMRREQREESERQEAIRSAEIDAHENIVGECQTPGCWICRDDAARYERRKLVLAGRG